jgi:hypothetical protein
MSNTTTNKTSHANRYRISGQYNINDVKYDLLKIIQPYDGLMHSDKDVSNIRSLFISYLNDLKHSWKIFSFNVDNVEKENAYTYDVHVQMHRERSPKKLKIHVGKLVYKQEENNVS